jgi:glycerol-3-phosphate cytidylyltransferase-like family protein
MTLPIETTNKVGAPEGNDNARKGKLFYDQLRRVLVQNDSLKLRQVSEKLVDAAIEGEPWAVKEVIDRMDGKAVAIQEIQGPDGTQLKAGFVLTFEEPNGNTSGS